MDYAGHVRRVLMQGSKSVLTGGILSMTRKHSATNGSKPNKIAPSPVSLTPLYPLSSNHYPLGGSNPFPFKSLTITHWRSRTCPDDLANPMILKNRGELEAQNLKLETDSTLAAIIVDSRTR